MQKIGIIGGQGKMGSWFQTYLSSKSFEVEISDLNTKLSNEELTKNTNIVFVSVPIGETYKVIESILPNLTLNHTIVDLSSIRQPSMELMLKSKAEVIGLHPMFSPAITSLKGQTVIVSVGREGKFLKKLEKLLSSDGASIKHCDQKTHDKMMAIIQGLTHFSHIATAECLRKLGLSVSETLEYTSPIYRIRMEMVGRIMAQDPRLYGEIEILNPETLKTIATFLESSEELFQHIKNKDLTRFTEYFERAGEFLGEFRKTSLADSNFLIEKLAERGNS